MDDQALRYWIGFNRIHGIGAARFHGLISYFGDLETAWNASAADLRNAVGDQRACDSILKARQTADLDADLRVLAQYDARAITLLDAEYPALLRQIDNPPPLLYIRGALTAADAFALSVVGTRAATQYGLQVTHNLTQALSEAGLTIVSGLAKGIDTAAHRATLGVHGRTLALLGHGIDRVYPPENAALAAQIAQHGALLTDFPVGTPPDGNNFPKRNRLISGLSLGVLVIEAQIGSGALGTAHLALDQGREVFAVPGSIYAPESQGTHLLIQSGEAKLISRAEDILAELLPGSADGINPARAAAARLEKANVPQASPLKSVKTAQHKTPGTILSAPNALPAAVNIPVERFLSTEDTSEPELLLLQSLSSVPIYIDELCALCGLPMVQVVATLLLLELRGRIRPAGPMSYVLADTTS